MAKKAEVTTKKVTTKKVASKKDKDIEKSFDMEKAVTNILKQLQDISERIDKMEDKINVINDILWYEEDEESLLDIVIDIYNKVEEVSEGLDLDEDDE